MDNPPGPGSEWRENLTMLNTSVSIICVCLLVGFTVFPLLAFEVGCFATDGSLLSCELGGEQRLLMTHPSGNETLGGGQWRPAASPASGAQRGEGTWSSGENGAGY